MSILRVDQIRDNGSGFNDVVTFANSGGTENGKLCRAWVNFNGDGTVAIRDDFNVNTITDHGTGNYTVNFSSSLSNANYAVVGGHGGTSASTIRMADAGPNLNSGGFSTTYQTTSGVRILNGLGSSSVPYDASYISILVFSS